MKDMRLRWVSCSQGIQGMGPSDSHYGSVKMQEEPETGLSGDGSGVIPAWHVRQLGGTFRETGSRSS